jgi:hypothetical protein
MSFLNSHQMNIQLDYTDRHDVFQRVYFFGSQIDSCKDLMQLNILAEKAYWFLACHRSNVNPDWFQSIDDQISFALERAWDRI